MSRWQRPWGIWQIFEGLREVLEAAGIPAPPRTREMELMAYARFTTGLTFTDVARMLWSPDPDPATWRRRSRGPILRLFAALKSDMYREVQRREDEAAVADRGYPASWDDVTGGGQLAGGE
jgi:hypothetical protein